MPSSGDRIGEGRGGRIALRTADRTYSYGDVEGLAGGFAAALTGLGVHREDRVVLLLTDRAEYVGALFGALKLAAVVVMVNPELDAGRIAEILDLASPQAVVHEARPGPVVSTAAAASTSPPRLLPVPDNGLDLAGRCSRGPHPSRRPGALAVLRAVPPVSPRRWCRPTGRSSTPRSATPTTTLGYREDDITLSVPKLIFGYATGSNLFFPFSVGASAVLFPEQPTVEVLVEQIARHRPTILITVPTMMSRMLADPAGRHADLSSVRFATSAGEALPGRALRTLEGRLRGRAARRAGDRRDVARLRHQPPR